MWTKLLVTLDGSAPSEAILPVIEAAAAPDTEIVLLTVAEAPSGMRSEGARPLLAAGAPAPGGVVTVPGPITAESRDQALQRVVEEKTEYLKGRAAGLKGKGIKVETVVAFGNPVEEIVSCASEKGVQVIAMSTHGRTGLAEVLIGSVTGEVIAKSHKPVLTVRPDGLS